MPFFGTFDDDQLSMMTAALAEYCNARGIRPGTPEHQDAATLMMSLFRNGPINLQAIGVPFNDRTDNADDRGDARSPHGYAACAPDRKRAQKRSAA